MTSSDALSGGVERKERKLQALRDETEQTKTPKVSIFLLSVRPAPAPEHDCTDDLDQYWMVTEATKVN